MVYPEPHGPVRVATAGEALIDLIGQPDGTLLPCAGGAVYNFTRALGRQQVGTTYLNPLSQDAFGRLLESGLRHAGVRLAQETPAAQPTSLAVVALDEQGKASYSFYRDGVADRQVDARGLDDACAALAQLRAVATGCLALAAEDRDRYLPWLRDQRAAGRLLAVDANLRPDALRGGGAYRANVMAALGLAHVVKVSDDDLRLLGFTDADPVSAALRLMDAIPDARWLALTLGGDGAVLIDRRGLRLHARETIPVPVADTVGAGDCFFAGLIAAMLALPADENADAATAIRADQAGLGHVLAHAVASASLCVMRTGCVPPTFEQVKTRLRDAPPRVQSAG